MCSATSFVRCFQNVTNMDTPFQFANPVTGKYFVGRKSDCAALADMISQGRSVAVWGPPKSGKMSVLRQTLQDMKQPGRDTLLCIVDMTTLHDAGAFVRKFVSMLVSTAEKGNAAGMAGSVARHLQGSSLAGICGDTFGLDDALALTDKDIDLAAELPFALAEDGMARMVVVLKEFQNIGTGRGELFMKSLERAMASHEASSQCSFVFMGSRPNAMAEIFLRRKFFWRQVSVMPLSMISDAEISDHVLRGFSAGGKVIERSLLQDVCRMFRNEMWYINHFFFICDSLSKGYISELTVSDALSCLIAVHEPRFRAVMDDLTGFQRSMLKAVLDGHVKFSATDVIEKYRLNSSANVKRLKDALMKKEVMMFNDKDEPEIEDPLFEYWLRRFYFK